MADYEKLTRNDKRKIKDFIKNIQLNLLTHGINIGYSLDFSKHLRTYIHASITNKKLQHESRFMTLFPLTENINREICLVNFTKTNNCYEITQDFYIGDIYNNKGIIEKVFNIKEGDKWKFDKYKSDGYIFSIEDCIYLSRKLIIKLIGSKFREVDERLLGSLEKCVTYKPKPCLSHEFGLIGMPELYTGSRVCLKGEVVKNLNESSLLENLIKFHEFFKSLNL